MQIPKNSIIASLCLFAVLFTTGCMKEVDDPNPRNIGVQVNALEEGGGMARSDGTTLSNNSPLLNAPLESLETSITFADEFDDVDLDPSWSWQNRVARD